MVTRHADTSCLSSHTSPSSVDTSGDELVHRGWLCLTCRPSLIPLRKPGLPRSRFPAGLLLKSCQRFFFSCYHPNGQTHNSSHSEFPEQGFGSLVGKGCSSFTAVRPPRRAVWHPETPHAGGTMMIAQRQIYVCV